MRFIIVDAEILILSLILLPKIFVIIFWKLYSHSNSTRAKELWEEYSAIIYVNGEAYRGLPITTTILILKV